MGVTGVIDKSRVLFLDIDGVTNNSTTTQRSQGAVGIDPALAAIVARIVQMTGCAVVLSSTWRLYPESRQAVTDLVVPFIDVTPDLKGVTDRGCEIAAWLRDHPEVARYAILDDNADFHKDQHLFKTSILTGITDEIAQQVINHLGEAA